ncbi:Uncharacterised protein [Candidatus Gugararchaeum adminiculabundum]|nr:Uncharacterised protein [Candidatus Gugararchaeum adminiculabundum]
MQEKFLPNFHPDSLVCDSSSLISLAESCFVKVFYMLADHSKGRFLLPSGVEYECISYPLQSKNHALSAVRLKRAVNDGKFSVVDTGQLQHLTDEIRNAGNSVFLLRGHPLKIIQQGECEMLALAHAAGLRYCLIDERTTRMLVEDPKGVKEHLAAEFHTRIDLDHRALFTFQQYTKGIAFIRSCELVARAYELGYFENYGEIKNSAFEAAMNKVKISGCSIMSQEVDDYVRYMTKKQ